MTVRALISALKHMDPMAEVFIEYYSEDSTGGGYSQHKAMSARPHTKFSQVHNEARYVPAGNGLYKREPASVTTTKHLRAIISVANDVTKPPR